MQQVFDILNHGINVGAGFTAGTLAFYAGSYGAAYLYERARFLEDNSSFEEVENRLEEVESSREDLEGVSEEYLDILYTGRIKALEKSQIEAERNEKQQQYFNQLYWKE